MKQFSLATSLLAVFWFTINVVSRVEGPFGLYTKSSDPTWNLRVISIGARNGYASITDTVSSPSQIQSASINFFLNTTSTLTPDAPYGDLVWGAQPPYQKLFGQITIIDTTSPIQPLFFDYGNRPIQGYASQWNFTSDRQLLLDNQANRFYAKELHTTFYNYPAIHWLFGSPDQNTNATAVTLWRYDP